MHVNTLFVPDIIKNNGRNLPPPPTQISHFLVLFLRFFVYFIVCLLLLIISIFVFFLCPFFINIIYCDCRNQYLCIS